MIILMIMFIHDNWLVVLTILKNVSQWEGLSHILWKIKSIWNHQPDIGIRDHGLRSPREYIIVYPCKSKFTGHSELPSESTPKNWWDPRVPSNGHILRVPDSADKPKYDNMHCCLHHVCYVMCIYIYRHIPENLLVIRQTKTIRSYINPIKFPLNPIGVSWFFPCSHIISV